MRLGIHALSDDDELKEPQPTGFKSCLDNLLLALMSFCKPRRRGRHDLVEYSGLVDVEIDVAQSGLVDVEIDEPMSFCKPPRRIRQNCSGLVDVEIDVAQSEMNSDDNNNNSEDDEEEDQEEEEDMIDQILALLAKEDEYYRWVIPTQNWKRYPDMIVRTVEGEWEGDTALHIAARSGNEDMVKHLVRFINKKKNEEGGSGFISLSHPNWEGNTPLHLAIEQGHQNVASYLIKKKPHVAYNKLNHNGVSPLYLAVKTRNLDLIQQLFIELPPRDLSTSTRDKLLQNWRAPIMHAAIKAHQIGILQVLSTNLPFLIESKNRNGWTPISYAAHKGYHKEVSYLVHEFPDIAKISDDNGAYPIHRPSFGDNIAVAESPSNS